MSQTGTWDAVWPIPAALKRRSGCADLSPMGEVKFPHHALAAELGGAPSIRHESARGHAGWTAWIAVVRIRKIRSARRYGSMQMMGPDARPMTNRLCRRNRTGERDRRGQCYCRELQCFLRRCLQNNNGAFCLVIEAVTISRRRLPTTAINNIVPLTQPAKVPLPPSPPIQN